MSRQGHVLSAGIALFTCLMGIALVVRGAAARVPPVYPITGIFFFASSSLLIVALSGLVWDGINGDPRAARLVWAASGGIIACGIVSFYSVGLFFWISGLDWAIVALTTQRQRGQGHRQGLLLALAVGIVLLFVLSYLKSLGPPYVPEPPPIRG